MSLCNDFNNHHPTYKTRSEASHPILGNKKIGPCQYFQVFFSIKMHHVLLKQFRDKRSVILMVRILFFVKQMFSRKFGCRAAKNGVHSRTQRAFKTKPMYILNFQDFFLVRYIIILKVSETFFQKPLQCKTIQVFYLSWISFDFDM